jgi:predicted acyl esterase
MLGALDGNQPGSGEMLTTRATSTHRRLLVAAIAVFCLAAPASAGAFTATGSVGQVYVTGATPGASMSLLDATSAPVATQTVNSLGGLLFRNVQPADGYRVRLDADGTLSAPVTVHSDAAAPWDPQVYNQSIPSSGYGYLTTRDGTQLAIDVHPPTNPAGLGLPAILPSSGPFPTLIEYSGYGYADPAGPDSGIATLANLMGFTVVDVNMRGTGCSGGAYNFFEPLQQLDGYDVIEAIAHQPWVLGHRVGMIGISYGGISQLFTAQTDPPDLAAIAPLSVLDATATTLYPGGILNTGFAVPWAQQRDADAEPAGPTSGQPWAYTRIQGGDQTCKANQALHPEAADLMSMIRANDHYVASVADPLDPITFVNKINVPTFMACQWEDEQTGGHCADLAEHFTGTQRKWFTFTNGAHIDSLDPYTYDRLFDFLDLFVAHQAPAFNQAVMRLTAPLAYNEAMGIPLTDPITLPADPIQLLPSYPLALAAYETLPQVRVLFDNGAGGAQPGDPYPGFERSFSSFPIPGTTARQWYLNPGGTLADQPPAAQGTDSYTSNPSATAANDYTTGGEAGDLWGNASQWHWNWAQNPPGTSVSYVSAPLSSNTVVIGGGNVRLWVESSAPDVDLQATVSEVRPDGNETFVQDGWLRASERKLSSTTNDPLKQASTLLDPVPSELASDVAPMPAGQFAEVDVPLYFEGHAYRAGSRIRVTIAAPNGAQPVWAFAETQPPAATTSNVSIAFSPTMPSSLILPVVPGVSVPTGLPSCASLRNEPCRPYKGG